MKLVYTLFCFFLLLTATIAQNPDSLFKQANEAYQQNDFESAIAQYEPILAAGYHSTGLYYNLGNCYYRKKMPGKAILHYERALLLNADEDVIYNLSIVRDQLEDEIEQVPQFFLARWWNNIAGITSAGNWAIVALFIIWAGALCLILWLLGISRSVKKIGFIVGVLLMISSLLPIGLAINQHRLFTHSQFAIIIQREISLQTAPDEESVQKLLLHEGTKVELLDKIGAWHKIRLANGEKGWLPDTSFEKI